MMVTKMLAIIFVSILLLKCCNVKQVLVAYAFTTTKSTITGTSGSSKGISSKLPVLQPFAVALTLNLNSNSNSNSNFNSESSIPHSESKSKSFFTQLPNESNDSYFQRITNAASDPLVFEQMVLHTNTNTNTETETEKQQQQQQQSESETDTTTSSSTGGGYVRAEVWEEEQQKQKKQLSWNEQVQFDGQRYGNQYIQNEIVRKNLKSF